MKSRMLSSIRLSFAGWRRLILLIGAAWVCSAIATNIAAPPACDVGASEDLGCARGFETRERDARGSFRWTDGAAAVVFQASGYGAPLIIDLALAAPRPADTPPPLTTLAVGSEHLLLTPTAELRRYRILAPRQSVSGDILRIDITSVPWRPPGDRRDLGIQVYHARLSPLVAPRFPAISHTFALAIIGLAVGSLSGATRTRAGDMSRLPELARRYAPMLFALGGCAGLWVWLPARSVPFFWILAAIMGFMVVLPALTGAPRRLIHIPWQVIGAIVGGAIIDVLFVNNLARGVWSVLALAIQTLLTVWAIAQVTRPVEPAAPDDHSWLPALLQITLLVRLIAYASRLLSGEGSSDPDIELFYSYGRAMLELGVPLVEYPSGALIPWALLALPASREWFALALPLLNTSADLLIVWAIWRIATARTPLIALRIGLPLFYALSPLLLPFWHGKYDSVPTALLALGLAAYAGGRYGWAGVMLGFGGAVKWAPWLAAPALALALVRGETTPWRDGSRLSGFLRFAAGGIIAILAASLPFAWLNVERFLAPYLLQGGRAIIGESIWFLPALLLDPALWNRLPAPWSPVDTGDLLLFLAVAVQLLVLIGLTLAALAARISLWRALALAALVPAAFLLLNRVFSPQYLLTITAMALVAGAAVARSRRDMLMLIGLLGVAQAANLLVWPNTVAWWPLASALMFAAALSALVRLTARRAPPPAEP